MDASSMAQMRLQAAQAVAHAATRSREAAAAAAAPQNGAAPASTSGTPGPPAQARATPPPALITTAPVQQQKQQGAKNTNNTQSHTPEDALATIPAAAQRLAHGSENASRTNETRSTAAVSAAPKPPVLTRRFNPNITRFDPTNPHIWTEAARAQHVASAPAAPATAAQQQQGELRAAQTQDKNAAQLSAAQSSAQDARGDGAGGWDPPPAPMCLLCTEPIVNLAMGACGHAEVCATCCLKSRLCYSNAKCPVCNAVQETVAIVPWTLEPGRQTAAVNSACAGRRARASGVTTHDAAWAKGVHVYTGPPIGPALLDELQAHTSNACTLCSGAAAARKPFVSLSALAKHTRSAHQLQLCQVCIASGRYFAHELRAMPAGEAATHIATLHEQCEFCRTRFFNADALYAHMTHEHMLCHVCEGLGTHHKYFRNPASLWEHMLDKHHACKEAECAGGMVAFATADALRTHRIGEHSNRMMPIDRTRVRTLEYDAAYMRSAHPPVPRPTRSSTTTTTIPEHHQNQQQQQSSYALTRRGGRQAPRHEGFVLIDDAEGSHLGDAGSFAGGTLRSLPPRDSQPQQQFPTLAPAAPQQRSTQQQRSVSAASVPVATAPSFRPLVRVQVSCPCGVKKLSQVVEEGQQPKALVCDSSCRQAQRQAQLVDAFDAQAVTPESAFLRRRDIDWPVDLVLKTRVDLDWVRDTEAKLAAFVADGTQKMLNLAGLSRQRTAILTLLAECYGLVHRPTAAVSGFERTQLLKSTTVCLPNVTLAKYVGSLTDQEVEHLAQTAAASLAILRLHDVASWPRVQLAFKEWSPVIERSLYDDTCGSVTFSTGDTKADGKAMREAAARYGGGVRGAFLIDKESARRAAATAPPTPAPSMTQTRPSFASASAGGSGGASAGGGGAWGRAAVESSSAKGSGAATWAGAMAGNGPAPVGKSKEGPGATRVSKFHMLGQMPAYEVNNEHRAGLWSATKRDAPAAKAAPPRKATGGSTANVDNWEQL